MSANSDVMGDSKGTDQPKAGGSPDDTHRMLMEQFREYADGTIDCRKLAEKCRDYRDGNQYTAEEREILKKRKQPCITDNKIQDKCDTLLGMEKSMRTDPKAYPRNPDDGDAADAATDALRFVAEECNYKRTARKPAADNLMVEGVCAGQVIVEKCPGSYPRVCIEHIRWDRLFYDVHSLRDDFEDKNYCGEFTWMDFDEAALEWADAKDALDSSFLDSNASGPDRAFDDKPRFVLTVRRRKRVQVFSHYFKQKGKWMFATWVKGGWLDKPKVSTYKDQYGQPTCPIEMQALYRDSNGAPYGAVQRYLDLQDEHNKRRSKMLHLLNAKRIIVQQGTVDNIAKVRAEVHKPDGVVEVKGPIGESMKVEDNLAESEGQWRLLQQTDAALSATGPNAALAGVSGDLSGVAKARDQQAGQLLTTPLFDALDAWELKLYRQAWSRIRQFWTAPMWVRVTDDPNRLKFVGLNQPITNGDQLAQQAGQDPRFQQMAPEDQQAIIHTIAQHPLSPQQAMHPQTGKPMRKNDVAQMDVDIIIDRGQDVITVQQEEFAQLAEIAKGRPEIPFSVLIQMSQLRQDTKRTVLESLQGNSPQEQQAKAQQAQFQQMMAQLEAALKQADVMKAQAQAAQAQAAAAESHIDAAVKTATFVTAPPQNEKTQVTVN